MKLGNPTYQARALRAARRLLEQFPSAPDGTIDHCSLHWGFVQYGWAIFRNQEKKTIPYQVIADMDSSGNYVLIPGISPLLNARAIPNEAKADIDYSASVRNRNAHGVAASVSAMFNATPKNFGDSPLNGQFVEFLCAGAAALCVKYDIDASSPESCYTHAEAAVRDGYFLGESSDAHWDFALLEACQEKTEHIKKHVPEIGNHLRLHVSAYKRKLLACEDADLSACEYCSSLTTVTPR